MKKWSLLLTILLVVAFALFALGSGESEEPASQGEGVASQTNNDALGEYTVVIDSCRLAEDYEGKPVAIIKYIFTNVSDEDPASFGVAMEAAVFQAGVGLNEAYVLDDSANYSSDNQSKEIKQGASIEVEVAYNLNDTTTPLEVEVSEWISFSDKKITKTFNIAQ